MNFPHGVMVTLVSTTTADDGLGNTTETTASYQWGPCAVAPRYAHESTDPRVPPVIVGKTVMGPPTMRDESDAVVPFAANSDDAMTLPDGTYQVDGLPGEWVNPFTGWAPGVEVPVKRTAAV